MDQKDDDDLQLSLSESLHSLHMSEVPPKNEKDDQVHILHNVEEWKYRKEAKEKAEAVEKIQQFKVKLIALEKEKVSQLYGKKNEFRKEFCHLEEQELKLTAERRKERDSVQHKIQRISLNVKKFRNEIEEPKSTHNFLEKLKVLMEDIESSILKYKQLQGALYDDMMKEEKQLNLDLESFEKKIQSWSTSSNMLSSRSKLMHHGEKKDTSVPPEVTAFQKYLAQTGGHQGGWDEYDHQTFLKLKKKHKAFDQFIESAESEIPTRSRDDIIQHDDWYREYLALRENKRMAIAKWKNMKESEKQDRLVKIENDAESERLRELKRREMLENEKVKRFAQLEKWKLDKELQKQKQTESIAKQKAEERLRKEEDEQKRRKETKVRVLEYQTKKKEEEAILELSRKVREEQEKRAKKISEEEQSRIRERDEKMLENKRRRIEQREKEKKEREKRLEKLRKQVEVRVEHDPSRLYQLTEGWKERNRSTKNDKSQPELHFQRRAVPNWRQGMS